jgi:general secretion pathway protein D
VRNRQSAKIMIGDKVPVITVTNTANVGTSESVSYLDVGLKLDIEPTISLDDDVSMKLSLEVSNIVDTITRATGTQTYRLGTRNTSTVLRVRDGETNVLAGLIQKEDRRSNTGIPILNELPLVSKLFGNSSNSDSKTEIILLITPHIIRNLEVPGIGLQEYTSGTENAIGAAPIQLGSTKPKTDSKNAPPTAPAAAVPPAPRLPVLQPAAAQAAPNMPPVPVIPAAPPAMASPAAPTVPQAPTQSPTPTEDNGDALIELRRLRRSSQTREVPSPPPTLLKP